MIQTLFCIHQFKSKDDSVMGNIFLNKFLDCKEFPVVIAEVSANHLQSFERMSSIVEAAADSKVDAIKLQTFTPDTITIKSSSKDFCISAEKSLWKDRFLYDLYQEAYTPWEWHQPIFELGRKLGLVVFSTPFDATAVDFLEEIGAPCYKIASFELTDIPLIRKVASTGKPMIMSTGMATVAEIDEAVRTARAHGCPEIVLLKCTSTYPAPPEASNLRTIPHMRELFNCEVGLSDHTLGIGVAVAGVALGATVIEKHFTLCRADGGVDAAFSMEPQEMKALVEETRRAWQALGNIRYGPAEAEMASMAHRRSLYITRDLEPGDVLSLENVRSIRPGHGLAPRYLDIILGKKVNRDVSRGTPVRWEMIG